MSVAPVGQQTRTLGRPPVRTPEFSVTVEDLENGQEYQFTVMVSKSPAATMDVQDCWLP